MVRYRSILSLMLAIVATFLVSCGGPTTATLPQTYTTAQVEQIQEYVPGILTLRDRMKEIPSMIQRRDWIDLSDFIHGPLGELRLKMTYVTRNLLPKDQAGAREATRDLFDDLVQIYQAAQQGDANKAILNYGEAFTDLDNFLKYVPQANTQEG